MAEIVRNRTIRPSTRQESSVNYRVDISGITSNDTLVINVSHESKSFRQTFMFKGSDVLKHKSLGFQVKDWSTHIEIIWSGVESTKQI